MSSFSHKYFGTSKKRIFLIIPHQGRSWFLLRHLPQLRPRLLQRERSQSQSRPGRPGRRFGLAKMTHMSIYIEFQSWMKVKVIKWSLFAGRQHEQDRPVPVHSTHPHLVGLQASFGGIPGWGRSRGKDDQVGLWRKRGLSIHSQSPSSISILNLHSQSPFSI